MGESGIVLSREYVYVVLDLVFYSFLNVWMSLQVGFARNKYKVFYPNLYASESDYKEAKLFNCIQRGHQNSLEMMPVFFMLMILGGLRHPLICASLGGIYIISRFFYFKGYATGDPQKRHTTGMFGFLAVYVLMDVMWRGASPRRRRRITSYVMNM